MSEGDGPAGAAPEGKDAGAASPAPWRPHGWRWFMAEYGVVVLGVLTALALQ